MEEELVVQPRTSEPSAAEVEQFSALFKTHLSDAAGSSSSSTKTWEQHQGKIPTPHRQYYNGIQQKLREEYHCQQALDRRNKLSSLLAQTPPFSYNTQDQRIGKTRRGQKRRYTQFEQFVKQYTNRSAIGVHPFFASLKRLLEYQGNGQLNRCCEWLLDDAVLMEAGGEEWMSSVVWILKGVLHFEEQGAAAGASAATNDPFVGENESMRWWTVASTLNDPECNSLARLIPSYVVPRRGRGSQAIQRIISDEENVKEFKLPTGTLRLSTDTFRDSDYRGSLIDRIWTWLMAIYY